MLFEEIKIRNTQFVKSKEVVDKYNAIKKYVKPAEAGSSNADAKKPPKKAGLDMRSYLDSEDDTYVKMAQEIRNALDEIDADTNNGINGDISEKFDDILHLVDQHQPLPTTEGYILKMHGRLKRFNEATIAQKVMDAHKYIQTLDEVGCKKPNLHLNL